PPAPEQATAELGLLFDETYDGRGLRIAEVLRGGPADRRGIAIHPGDILLKIDGTDLTEKVNLARLLNDHVGETVSLLIAPGAEIAKAMRVNVQCVARKQIAELMYERWIRKNAEKVNELSKGTLGYIHIPSMN